MFYVCRHLSNPLAGDSHSLRSRKRLERLQRQGLAALNNCQSDAVRIGSTSVTPECLSPISVNSHGESHKVYDQCCQPFLVCGPTLHLRVYRVHSRYLQSLPDVHGFTLDVFLKRSLKNWKNSMFQTHAKFFFAGMKAQ